MSFANSSYGPKLFSDDCILNNNPVLKKTIGNIDCKIESLDDVVNFFELNRCKQWINVHNFKRVALQFPDFYLPYSFSIAQFLENELSKIYILGDTSYGSCCVEEVAAEHANCDSLIHFGDACLSTTIEKMPILYIFCQSQLNLNKFENELINKKDLLKDVSNIGLLFDSVYANQINAIRNITVKYFPSIKIFEIANIENSKDLINDVNKEKIVCGRKVQNDVMKWENAILIFIGLQSSSLLPLWLMTFVQFTQVLHYFPNDNTCEIMQSISSKMLKKRLYLVEKLKDAQNVGLVIGTLAIDRFTEAIIRIRTLCKNAKKKLYVFSMGKFNDAKLSNFADNVDVFILLSCPFGIIFNTSNFYKPILSFFEAEIALNSKKTWFFKEGWTSEFNNILQNKIDNDDSEHVDVSLITGRIRSTNLKSDFNKNLTNSKNQVVEYLGNNYFENRTWKGLNDDCVKTFISDTQLKVGLDGIASSYVSEKNE